MDLDNGSTSTVHGDSTANFPTSSSPSFFRNRFSNASLLTLSSIRTLLPHYSAANASGQPEPPRYSALNEGEFQYAYPIRSKKPWATLQFHTRDAVPGNPKPLQTRPKFPRFWSCDPFSGKLELDLDSPQNIQQISIFLSAKVVMSALSEESIQFLAHEYTIWDKSKDSPLPSNDAHSNGIQNKKIEGRFVPGQYTLPFSFPFPTDADPLVSPSPAFSSSKDVPRTAGKQKWSSRFTSSRVSPSGMEETSSASSETEPSNHSSTSAMMPGTRHSLASSKLPQSFMEKGVNHDVVYEILVRIDHGRFKANSKIMTTFTYIPATQPLPAPQRRRDAYEAGSLLPCPMEDPEGWFVLPSLTICGVVTLDEEPRRTQADCTLYLAQPLSYTRGSVIPCFLTISGEDEGLVELLSNPRTPGLRLLRCIRHPKGEVDKLVAERTNGLGMGIGSMSPGITTSPTSELKLVNHEVGRAQWWTPPKNVVQNSTLRHLEGEIHLSPNLPPSCDFQSFQVQYDVELMSFRTDKFEPDIRPSSRGKSRKTDVVLTSRAVEITTLRREDEPVPTAYSEPPNIPIMRPINEDDKRVTILEDQK